MARYWQLLVKARGETKPAQKAMRDLRKSSRELQRAIGIDFRSVARNSAIALGAGLAATVRIGVNELREARVVSAQLDTALRNNGRNAGVTRDAIDKLATSLSYKAAVDDELIASAAAQTLAFRNVRNEAGRGNDIFTRLQKASLDYSSATNRDLVGSQIKFARALNEPAKASKLLRSAGVALTKAQQDQLKVLTDSGDTLGAQRFILAQLEARYRGAAAAAGDAKPFERLKVVFANLAATLVGGAGSGFGAFTNRLSAAIVKLDLFFQSARGQAVLAQMNAALAKLGSVLVSAFRIAVDFGRTLYQWRDVLIPVTAAVTAMFAAWRAYKILKAARVAFLALNAAMLANPVGAVILAIVGLVAVFVTLYKRSTTFRAAVDTVTARFKAFAAAAVPVLRNIWQKMQPVVNVLKLIARLYIASVVARFKMLGAVAVAIWNGLQAAWGKATALFNRVRNAVNTVVGAFRIVRAAIGNLPEKAGEVGRAIIEGIKRGVREKAQQLVDYVRDLGGRLLDGIRKRLGIKSPSRVFARQVGQPIVEGIAVGISRNVEKASKAMDALAERMTARLRSRLLGNDLRQAFLDYRLAEAKFVGGGTAELLRSQLANVMQRIRALKDFLRKNARKLRAETKLDILGQLTSLFDTAADIRGQMQEAGQAAGVAPGGAPVTMRDPWAPQPRQAPAPIQPRSGNTYNVVVNAQQPVDTVSFMRSLRVAARMGTV